MKHFNISARRRVSLSPAVRALALFLWMVALVMLPNLILAFTEDYGAWSVAVGLTLPLGLYLLTTMLTRRVTILVLMLMPILVLGLVQVVLLYLYGNSIIAVDMFTNMMTTSASESGELLHGLMPLLVVITLVCLPLLYALVRQIGHPDCMLSERARSLLATLGAVLTIVGVQLLYPAELVSGSRVLRCEIFPMNAIHNLRIALANSDDVRHYESLSAEFAYEAEREPLAACREVYVYVIGESSRAANWSLYGYNRVTNPRLGRRADISLFKNVVTQSNTTHKSVPLMLSSASAIDYDQLFRRKGLAALFGEVGFRTCFISAQSRQGAMIDNLARECDQVLYLDAPCYDGDMLQLMRQAIEADERDLLVILHSYGSHYCYNMRYPRQFARFQPEDRTDVDVGNLFSLRNAYDNTILYTDYLLDSVIEYLDSQGLCAAMLYCSDHGEGLFDDERGGFLHASTKVTYFQLHIPSLVWFSQSYRELHPDHCANAARNRWAAASTRAMFHTMADIASIRSPYVEPRLSLVSGEYDSHQRRLYLDDRNRAVALDERIGIGELDHREFLLHGINL